MESAPKLFDSSIDYGQYLHINVESKSNSFGDKRHQNCHNVQNLLSAECVKLDFLTYVDLGNVIVLLL